MERNLFRLVSIADVIELRFLLNYFNSFTILSPSLNPDPIAPSTVAILFGFVASPAKRILGLPSKPFTGTERASFADVILFILCRTVSYEYVPRKLGLVHHLELKKLNS